MQFPIIAASGAGFSRRLVIDQCRAQALGFGLAIGGPSDLTPSFASLPGRGDLEVFRHILEQFLKRLRGVAIGFEIELDNTQAIQGQLAQLRINLTIEQFFQALRCHDPALWPAVFKFHLGQLQRGVVHQLAARMLLQKLFVKRNRISVLPGRSFTPSRLIKCPIPNGRSGGYLIKAANGLIPLREFHMRQTEVKGAFIHFLVGIMILQKRR